MARSYDDDYEDEAPRRGKGKGFWTLNRILFLALFIAGFLVGLAAYDQVLVPLKTGALTDDVNALQAQNASLDALHDRYYRCLTRNNVDPATC